MAVQLGQTLTKVGTSMYEAAGAADGAGAEAGPNGAADVDGAAPGAPDDATVEGEFREVGADR